VHDDALVFFPAVVRNQQIGYPAWELPTVVSYRDVVDVGEIQTGSAYRGEYDRQAHRPPGWRDVVLGER
jgi:hypothetical protein